MRRLVLGVALLSALAGCLGSPPSDAQETAWSTFTDPAYPGLEVKAKANIKDGQLVVLGSVDAAEGTDYGIPTGCGAVPWRHELVNPAGQKTNYPFDIWRLLFCVPHPMPGPMPDVLDTNFTWNGSTGLPLGEDFIVHQGPHAWRLTLLVFDGVTAPGTNRTDPWVAFEASWPVVVDPKGGMTVGEISWRLYAKENAIPSWYSGGQGP